MRKDAVRFGGVSPEIVLGIFITQDCFRRAGEVFVMTSVTDGKHGQLSYHRAGYGFDCSLPFFAIGKLVNSLRQMLGPEFDVVVEEDHLHVEFDVRKQGSR